MLCPACGSGGVAAHLSAEKLSEIVAKALGVNAEAERQRDLLGHLWGAETPTPSLISFLV